MIKTRTRRVNDTTALTALGGIGSTERMRVKEILPGGLAFLALQAEHGPFREIAAPGMVSGLRAPPEVGSGFVPVHPTWIGPP